MKDEAGAVTRLVGTCLDVTEERAREERERRLEERWEGGGLGFLGAFPDAIVTAEANELGAAFVRDKIRGVVDAPAVAELLSPTQAIGCKRLCVDTGYYETFNEPHVRLVDISDGGIEMFRPRAVAIERYRYRGTKIPTPWTSAPTTGPTAPAA